MITYNIIDNSYDLFDFFEDVDEIDECCDVSTTDFLHTEYPFVNIYEGEEEVTVKAALPGMKAEELNIEIKNDILTIEGEKKHDYTENSYIRQERTFGKFKKTISLPYSVDAGKIKADLKDGLLDITLPKSEDAKPKKIEIR